MPKVRGRQLQLRVPAAAGGPAPDARHHGSTKTPQVPVVAKRSTTF